MSIFVIRYHFSEHSVFFCSKKKLRIMIGFYRITKQRFRRPKVLKTFSCDRQILIEFVSIYDITRCFKLFRIVIHQSKFSLKSRFIFFFGSIRMRCRKYIPYSPSETVSIPRCKSPRQAGLGSPASANRSGAAAVRSRLLRP